VMPVTVLLAGCSSDPDEGQAAPAATSPATSAATSPAPSSAADPVAAPACPDAATLAAAAPDQPPGVQLTDPTCSGEWAVIGINGPTLGPVVQVFRYVSGAWQAADRDAACAAGELPADIEPGVCQAG
jgi:hypothetical protein